jgi:hypothetical protein
VRRDLGEALVECGTTNPDVVVLDADASSSTMTILFQKAFPDRFYNVGIAEAGMIDTAVGLALGGKVPFASASPRCCQPRARADPRAWRITANVKLRRGYAACPTSMTGRPTTVFNRGDAQRMLSWCRRQRACAVRAAAERHGLRTSAVSGRRAGGVRQDGLRSGGVY